MLLSYSIPTSEVSRASCAEMIAVSRLSVDSGDHATRDPTAKNDSITHRKRCSGPGRDHGGASASRTQLVNPSSAGSRGPDQPARGKPGLKQKGGRTPVMGGRAAPIVADRQRQSILGGMVRWSRTEMILRGELRGGQRWRRRE
jgi:hypothetical protein